MTSGHQMELNDSRAQFALAWRLLGDDDGIGVRDIQDAVCQYFGLTRVQLLSNRRTPDIVVPRNIAVFLCRDLSGKSYPQIGAAFAKRDHTTMMASVRSIEKLRANNEFIEEAIKEISELLGASHD